MWGGGGCCSVSNFIKHLTFTLGSRLPRQTYRFLLRHPPHLTSAYNPHFQFQCQPRLSSVCASFSSLPDATSDNPTLPPYHSILIRCRKDVADSLSEALLSFGASSVSFDEHEDYGNSDEVSICSIFTGCGDVDSCISLAADSIGLETPTFELLKYNPYEWIKRTQESFDPVEVTTGLWIVPEWKSPPDAYATNIFLNPGFAFGTGEHATTKLCLLLLHQTVQGGEHFLDYGTGSGILSIAALKLGGALSVGVDIDPKAITAALQNADLNNIGPDKLKLHLVPEKDDASNGDENRDDVQHSEELVGDSFLTDKAQFDIVIANILLNPLLDLADEIVSHAKAGATVGLSGILHEQVPSVMERYSQFLENISVMPMEDWACVKGRRKMD